MGLGDRFIDSDAYFGEEFSRERADVVVDSTQAWGDSGDWNLDENTACTFSILDDTASGIYRQSFTGILSCLAYLGAGAGNAHLMFDADNLPVIEMKVRMSAIGFNELVWVGLGDSVIASDPPANGSAPTNGIYFTNDNSVGGIWWGQVKSPSGQTTAVCTGQAVDTANFAYLRIEVRSTTDVRFFVDPNVSNGITEVECGNGISTNVPTVPLTAMLMSDKTAGTTTLNLDVDYLRVWQQN
jgi:hypothetical protein